MGKVSRRIRAVTAAVVLGLLVGGCGAGAPVVVSQGSDEPGTATTSAGDRGEHVLQSGRSPEGRWTVVAFEGDGQDCVEFRVDDRLRSGTCDFRETEAGRLPAEFGVKAMGDDVFVYGAVAAGTTELVLTGREGTRVRVQPTAPDVAGTRVPVFSAHLRSATQVTAIDATRADGAVVSIDPGPGGIEPPAAPARR